MKKLLTVAVAAMTLAGTVNAQALKGDIKAAESKVAMCIGCHAIPGYRISYPIKRGSVSTQRCVVLPVL
jgi:cytochrome c553